METSDAEPNRGFCLILAASLTFLAFFTRSKSLNSSDVAPQNPLMNRFAAMTVSNTDVPNTVQISANYQLPFGPGKRFATGGNKLGSRLIAGWELTTSLRYQSGTPLSLAGSGSLGALG